MREKVFLVFFALVFTAMHSEAQDNNSYPRPAAIHQVFKGAKFKKLEFSWNNNLKRYDMIYKIVIDNPADPEGAKKIALNKYRFDKYKPVFYDGILGIYNEEVGKIGFVDEDGNLLEGGYKWSYDFLDDFPRFSNGVCLVKTTTGRGVSDRVTTWFVLSKNGNAKKLNFSIVHFKNFNEDGIAAVVLEEKTNGRRSYRTAYINANGQEVYRNMSAPCNHMTTPHELGKFCDGLAKYFDYKTRSYGFINKTGTPVIKGLYSATDFSEGYSIIQTRVQGALKYVYIDTKGEIAISTSFTNKPGNFHCGFAPVKKTNGKYVFIDKKGEIASIEYNNVTEFYPCGLALVNPISREEPGFIINTDFKKTVELDGDSYFSSYDKEEAPKYWNGLAGLIDLTTGHGFSFDLREGGQPVSDKLIYAKIYNGANNLKDGFFNIEGCNWVFYIDKDEF
ncbi:MAG: WG repeat-containing protein [Bacteroidaceae bacterium]|nr:WG repeat-containing protein [Bacteroidaceae bacterium]